MVALEELLTTALKNVASLFPARVINADEQGVRWTLGRASEPLKKGLYFFLPGVGHIDKVDITDGSLSIEDLTVGKSTYSAALVYRVYNAQHYLLNLSDDDSADTLQLIVEGLLSFHVERTDSREEICDGVLGDFNRDVRKYGVEGLEFYLRDAVEETTNVRLLGGTL